MTIISKLGLLKKNGTLESSKETFHCVCALAVYKHVLAQPVKACVEPTLA